MALMTVWYSVVMTAIVAALAALEWWLLSLTPFWLVLTICVLMFARFIGRIGYDIAVDLENEASAKTCRKEQP